MAWCTESSAGPGSYNMSGMGSDSMRKAYVESTRRGAFGTTSMRIQPIIKKTDVELPGPSHYQVKDKDKAFQTRYKTLSSNFASLSDRLPEPPPTVKVTRVHEWSFLMGITPWAVRGQGTLTKQNKSKLADVVQRYSGITLLWPVCCMLAMTYRYTVARVPCPITNRNPIVSLVHLLWPPLA